MSLLKSVVQLLLEHMHLSRCAIQEFLRAGLLRRVGSGVLLRWPGDQVNNSCSSIGQMTWVERFSNFGVESVQTSIQQSRSMCRKPSSPLHDLSLF